MPPNTHEHHHHLAPEVPTNDPVHENQPVDRVVFGVGMALTTAFMLWGVLAPESLASTAEKLLGRTIDATGWIYVLASGGFVVLMLLLAVSRTAGSGWGPTTSAPSSAPARGSR